MDDDLDDIAYVGDDDDRRGPGCVLALATVASAVGAILAGIVLVCGVMQGLFAPQPLSPNAFFWQVMLFILLVFAVAGGGFGAGLAGYAIPQARAVDRPTLVPVARALLVAGLAVAAAAVVLATVLIGVNFWR
jgi:hypothetical protein